ncbi:MAG: hypothetical protein OXF79_00285 [Chloroflexi bacterium]|nr:hypothetical protein [Chloroflexota bacterium]
MSILMDVRDDLVNDSATLANTLRKAKILASDLGVSEFREWVDAELAGYPDLTKLPTYRKFLATNIGTFAGAAAVVRNVVLPTYGLPDAVKDYAANLLVHQGVGELEGMLNTESEQFQKHWPQEFVMLSQQATALTNGAILVAAHQPIPRSLIAGVLDNVKNKLLDFILSLQELNAQTDGDGTHNVPIGTVRNLFQININGDHNIVASGENVHQEVSEIVPGDVGSLIDHFRQLGIDDTDLAELKVAVEAEPSASNGTFGPVVHAWVGRMLMKAASGIWNMGLEAAPIALQTGLNHFYGG